MNSSITFDTRTLIKYVIEVKYYGSYAHNMHWIDNTPEILDDLDINIQLVYDKKDYPEVGSLNINLIINI